MDNKAAKILKHDVPLRLVKVLNIFCLTIPFACCWHGYYAGKIENTFSRRENLLMIGLFMVVYFLFARVYSAFLVSVNRISEMVYSQVLAALITDGISYLVIALLVRGFPNIIPVLWLLPVRFLCQPCGAFWHITGISGHFRLRRH